MVGRYQLSLCEEPSPPELCCIPPWCSGRQRDHHAAKVCIDNEIIMPPKSASIDIYDLFIKATIQRPLLFEVKCPYNNAVPPKKLALNGPHSLHRFVINETGTLGIALQQNPYSATTTVVSIKPNSLRDIYGFHENDVICEPLNSVVALAQSDERPWIVQVEGCSNEDRRSYSK